MAPENRAGKLRGRKLYDLGDDIIMKDANIIHQEQLEYDTELLTSISSIQGGEAASLNAGMTVLSRVLSAV